MRASNFYTELWNSLIMQIYANLFKINEKCYFSVISWPILILFVLSDRAWCGLQNFYTELWNSLIMQIYAHLFKINEKCHLSSIQKSQQICTWGGDIYYASRNLLSTCFFSFCLTFWGMENSCRATNLSSGWLKISAHLLNSSAPTSSLSSVVMMKRI